MSAELFNGAMATIEINKDNFRQIYADNDIVIIDFWASWCGPCMNFLPTYEKVSGDFPDVVFGKVDTEIEKEMSEHFSIRSIPTLMVIRGGYEVFYQPGALSEEHLRELIEKVKELDMEDVIKKLEEQDKNEEN